jgi:phosphatidylglycerophosphate synthase
MSLLERLLRAVGVAAKAGTEFSEVCIAIGPGEVRPAIPEALRATLPIVFDDDPGDALERLAAYAEKDSPVVAMHGESIVDPRLLTQLAEVEGSLVFLGEGQRDLDPGAVMRLEAGTRPVGESWIQAAIALVSSGGARRAGPADFEGYITMLRRDLAPYVFSIPDSAARKRVERFLFWSNYKGSTDFMTAHVYPPLVWLLVRPLARWRVHPNWVTFLNIAATVAAIPFFMAGAWFPGLFLAYLMSVLDSVDGKLARVTFTSSKLGEYLDHGLDWVHPPFWYLAWGYALGGQQTASAPYQAAEFMLVIYFLDRATATVFKSRHGRSMHGATPFDERMRTFISRRNANLPFFTAAVTLDALNPGLGAAVVTFYAIVAWQAVCLVFHVWRVVALWNTGR